MVYHFVQMIEEYARTIVAEWKYGGEYAIHNYVNEVDHILDKKGWGKGLFAVLDNDGRLVGELTITFFDQSDQFIEYDQLDEENLSRAEMWVGFGLRPDLIGRGLGYDFVSACVEYAVALYQYRGEYVRLGVPAFNKRAITVYERVGFEPFDWVMGEIAGQSVEVVWMRKRFTL